MTPDARHDEETVRKDDYELTFYPGFCSRASVTEADGTRHELFEQTRTYELPDGQTRPNTKHTIRLRGGQTKQDITLHIDDPELRIARITIALYPEAPREDCEPSDEDVEIFEVRNRAETCPPHCEPT